VVAAGRLDRRMAALVVLAAAAVAATLEGMVVSLAVGGQVGQLLERQQVDRAR